MLRGSINHLDLTVGDLSVSEPFYDSILGYLGFERLEPPPGTTSGTTSGRPAWHAKDPAQRLFSIALCQARRGSRPHDRFTPGLHHLAFQAESREDVDGLHRFLLTNQMTVLDPPADYPQYWPVYYAVFFADPDGLKLEFVHMV
ncbi:MAG: VOC family protein [Geminicoccaceae bacterium]